MLCISSISSPSRQRQKKLHHGVLLAGLGSTEFTQDSWFRRRKISDRLMGQWYRWTFPEIGFLISWWFGTVFFFVFLHVPSLPRCWGMFVSVHKDSWRLVDMKQHQHHQCAAFKMIQCASDAICVFRLGDAFEADSCLVL
jgi:hypothetical protein